MDQYDPAAKEGSYSSPCGGHEPASLVAKHIICECVFTRDKGPGLFVAFFLSGHPAVQVAMCNLWYGR